MSTQHVQPAWICEGGEVEGGESCAFETGNWCDRINGLQQGQPGDVKWILIELIDENCLLRDFEIGGAVEKMSVIIASLGRVLFWSPDRP
jgi:hypothetical protein